MTLDPYWQTYPFTVVLFLLVLSLIVLLNDLTIPRLGEFRFAGDLPRVSVLIPARNEEQNIAACVESLLVQDYPDFEVLVLDDHSTDQTPAILQQLAQREARLQVIPGDSLPEGWLGKHWANHQLSQRATGGLLLFTDADTRHAPDTLRESVAALIVQQADLLTAFPRQDMLTWGERLTVPILSFSILSFFPILLIKRLRLAALSVTIGQFMLFRRNAFDAIGGYASVRADVVDDVMLGRRIMATGLHWQLVDGTRHVSCRMYRDFSSAWSGFTKNLFAMFGHHILLYAIAWCWIGACFLLPPLALVSGTLSRLLNFPTAIAAVAVLEGLFIFSVAYRRFRFPMYLVVLYPIHVAVFILLAMRSLLHTLLGSGSWKGRTLPPPVLRL